MSRTTRVLLSYAATFTALAGLLVIAGSTSGTRSAPALGAGARPAPGVQVTWVPTEAPLFTGEEKVPPGGVRWQLLSGRIGGPARLLYDTPRRLLGPAWSADGSRLSIRFASQSIIPPNGPNIVAGVLSFDVASPQARPAEVAVQVGGLQIVGFQPSPDGRTTVVVAVTSAVPRPGDIPPGMGLRPDTDIILLDVQTKSARRLTGLPGRVSPATSSTWSPDGRFFLAYSDSGPAIVAPDGPRAGDFYAVPVTDGPARLVTTAVSIRGAWSPNRPYRLAYVDDQRALWLFDTATGQSRQLMPGDWPAEARTDPAWVGPDLIQLNERVVDIRSGAVTAYPQPAYTDLPAVSPDGRYLAAVERTNDYSSPPGLCPWSGITENRVYLYDHSTGATTLLKDCDGRALIWPQWLGDSRHAVLAFAECYQCGPEKTGFVLMDVATGQETPLTNGLEAQAWAIPSPDGRKLLVTGERLRVYDSEGRLLQDMQPPEGFKVVGAAWAPDSRRYAYVVAPTSVHGFE